MKRFYTLTISVLLLFSAAVAQNVRQAYERAEAVLNGSLGKLVVDGSVRPEWARQSPTFWYLKTAGDTKEFLLVNAAEGTRALAFDQAKMAVALGKATGKTYNAKELPFDFITLDANGAIEVDAEGSHWSCNLDEEKCANIGPARPAGRGGRGGGGRGGRGGRGGEEAGVPRVPGESPDGVWVAFVRDNNLWVRTVTAGQEIQLTTDGTPLEPYATGWVNLGVLVEQQTGKVAEGGAPSGNQSPMVDWSPDSTKIATFHLDMRDAPPAFALEVSPPNRFLPIPYSYNYAYPSAPVLPTTTPIIFDVKTRKRVNVQAEPEQLLYGGGGNYRWFENSQAIYFNHTERGFKRMQMLVADAETGKVHVVIDEHPKDYVEASKFQYRLIHDGEEYIYTSERDGWNHLYLLDANGNVKNKITSGDWAVRSIDRVDEAKRIVYFSAGGKEPGDPYLRRVYSVGFDGSNMKLLTPEDADHVPTFSPDGQYFVNNYSRVNLPPVSVLRKADGALVMNLEKSDISKLQAAGWKEPERFKEKGRDGTTDIYGVLWRPTNFDPSKKYPIIEQIYTGPQGFFAPDTFAAYRNGCQVMAELGTLCIMVDGMGTDGRSHAFHAVSWKNLGDCGLPDHIAAMKQLAEKYPYMDLTRVGVYGHSAGGYGSTHAMLTHPEFYKVAVSSAGDHDMRLDKAGWVEQWMSYPAGKWYSDQSNITLAKNLQGKLFIAVGDVDDNVTPVSTMKLAAALVEAKKDFDFLIMPNAAHGFGNDPYFVRRRWNFFVRYLLDETPPENFQITPATPAQ